MRVARARHGDRAANIVSPLPDSFGIMSSSFELQAGRVTAALGHEAGNNAVKNKAVVEAAVDELEEVPDRDRRLPTVEFEDDVAFGRLYLDVGMRRHLVRSQATVAKSPKIRAIRVFFIAASSDVGAAFACGQTKRMYQEL